MNQTQYQNTLDYILYAAKLAAQEGQFYLYVQRPQAAIVALDLQYKGKVKVVETVGLDFAKIQIGGVA